MGCAGFVQLTALISHRDFAIPEAIPTVTSGFIEISAKGYVPFDTRCKMAYFEVAIAHKTDRALGEADW